MDLSELRVTGVILAGGRGSRMGHLDKPLMDIGGKSIMAHVIANASAQVDTLLLNVNRNPEKYIDFALPILNDCTGNYAGPLAGILTAMTWCRQQSEQPGLIACFPGDVPWFPADTVERLRLALVATSSETAWLSTDGQYQPLFSLWSPLLFDRLQIALQDQMYSPMQFILSTRNALVEINGGPRAHFLNINTPADLEQARALY